MCRLVMTEPARAASPACSPCASAPLDEPFLTTFSRIARERPDAIAARCQARHLTYRELDARSDLLARLLIERGVRADSAVAVCVEPSLDVLVALLAIFKLGAIYVPIDPTHPVAHSTAIVEESAPRALICHAQLVQTLVPAALRVELDAGWCERAATLPEAARAKPSIEAPAYVFYTSGTTGRPKGVLASHRNLAHYL
jgi:non-ribosomal peptide synthetase component F